MRQNKEVRLNFFLSLRFWQHLQFIGILIKMHFKYPLLKENTNMKYVIQKKWKHSLQLATNTPFSISVG